ncbi:hypothetical protein C0J52_21638 [Blattella germanica]|nr:hypothetical protein C0J52_21638 [Blattella germanica]
MASRLLFSSLRQVQKFQKACFHNRARIGNREVVGFGYNGQCSYQDRPDFPMPAIRFKESTPDIVKRSTRPQHTTIYVDDFDRRDIKNIISDFYICEKKVPTVSKLLPVIRSKINFPWSGRSLNRLLIKIGYKWKKTQSKGKVLIERADIVEWRHQYLRKIEQFHNEGREIVYLDESWVDNNLTFKKCWEHADKFGIQGNHSAGNRRIVLHAVFKPLPESFSEESKRAQLKRMIDLRVSPIEGLGSKYDYEKGEWKK